MKKRKIIDISTEEKRNEVFEIFNSLNSKNKAHQYFGISDNKEGSKYLKEIALSVGFDFNVYNERRKKTIRYCKECGKEITSKWAKDFCSSSCSAKYNNKQRDKSVYEKVAEKLRKKETGNYAPSKRYCVVCGKELHGNQIKYCCENCRKENKKKTFIKKCEFCGKEFNASAKRVKYCSDKCVAERKHNESYKDFLENNEKYCRGNYTPKCFKNEFLKEQCGICAICGCKPEHNGKPLVFILDHIDGDASNNKRENLRLICPNCDSQLDTFKSKNKHSARRNYWKEHILSGLK